MTKTYDAIIVLSGGIAKQADRFVTTSYADDDGFGMMGGRMRIIAASMLYAKRASSVFVFTTGTTAKTIEALGPAVPSEAAVYSQEFLALLPSGSGEQPEIIVEERSTNTLGNVREFAAIIKDRAWKNVAVLSSDYHIPRIKALCDTFDIPASLSFVSAEDVVRQEQPGKYDTQIEQAYASELGKKRLQNEAIGTKALKESSYTPAEHQLGQDAA